MKKLILAAAGIVLLGILSMFFFQDSDYKARIKISENSHMDDVTITQKRNGETRLVVNAKSAVFESEKDVKLVDLTLHFPEKGLILTAETGRYNADSRDITIEGDIKAGTKDYDIVTNKLNWDAAKSELVSDDKVIIVGKKKAFYVEGKTLTAHGDKATLRKDVKAVFGGRK